MSYGAALIQNLCSKVTLPLHFTQAYALSGKDVICPILKLCERLVGVCGGKEFSGDGEELDKAQRGMLRGCYAALTARVVKNIAREADGANFIKGNMEINGPLNQVWSVELGFILDRMLESVKGTGEGDVADDDMRNEDTAGIDSKITALEDNAIFPWDTFVSSEERLHSSIDKDNDGSLPEGWMDAIDPATGFRYFYKTDGTDESTWTLPIASEKILEGFYSSKRFM